MSPTRRIAPRRRPAVMALLIGALLALVAPSIVSAASRDRSSYSLSFSGTIDCGTFQDTYVDRYDVAETDVYDAAGTLVRVTYHVAHSSDDMNSVTGLTLHEHGHFFETDDYIALTYTVAGNSEIAGRPGTGVVIQDTGRQVYDFDGNLLFFAGGRKHSQIQLGEQIWCDALE